MASRIVAPATGAASFDGRSPIAVAPGVTLRRWPYSDEYHGTADALIAYGLITADQLPAKSCATFYNDEAVAKGQGAKRDERYLHILRSGKKYRVSVGLPEVEKKRRAEAQAEYRRREREKQKAVAEAAFYSDPEQLQLAARVYLESLRRLLADHTPGDHERDAPSYRLRFSSDGIADVLESLMEIREWIDAATIRPAASDTPQAPKALRAAKADKGFQAFLQSQCLKGE